MNVWVTHHICHIWSPHHLLWKPLKKPKIPPPPKKTLLPHFFCFCFALWFWSFIFRMGLCIRMNLGGPDFLSFAPPSHMFWNSSIYFKLWQHTTTSDVNKKQVHQILSRFFATEEKSWITCCNTSIQPPNNQNGGNCSSMFCKLKKMVRKNWKQKIDAISWFSSFHDPNFFT